MRLQLLSDVHLEFHADHGKAFVESLRPDGIDVLVLAGDIAVGRQIPAALDLFCSRFEQAQVVYVHGNHEYYTTERDAVLAATLEAVSAHENLVWLDSSAAAVCGQRFLGATLWFPQRSMTDRLRRAMYDFSAIPNFESWVYAENARALAFFETELREGDIVVTHHLPSQRSVSPRFSGHPLNPFFVCDVEELIRARRPSLWMHGHTHTSARYTIGPTTVLCNPFGYVGFDLNSDFVEGCIYDAGKEPRV